MMHHVFRYDTDLVVTITFNGAMNAGNVYALECKTAYCGSGCQPKMEHPLDFKKGGCDGAWGITRGVNMRLKHFLLCFP